MAVAEILEVLQALREMAEAARELSELYDDKGEIDETLDRIVRDLQDLRLELTRGINEILAAIGEVEHQIDEDVAFDNMALADKAVYNDLGVFQDKQAAMGDSFLAADRLLRETDVVFATAFMYVVNIRLAVLKDFDPNFACRQQFRDEVRAYIDHLNGWIAQLNDLIGKLHVVVVEKVTDVVDDDGRPQVVLRYWMAQHIRDGVIVDTFTGEVGDLSSSTRLRVERQARDSRNSGVAEDRENLGVVNMEGVAESWEQSIGVDLRLNLVRQVLNRPARAIDFSPNGLMVDGRVIPADLDLRTTLIELLTSQEFRTRIKTIWQGFIDRDRDELVQFAVRRLFGRDPEVDENEALRQLARRYGFGAFVAALLYSDEYEQRFGAGLPGAETRDEDRPITAELELQR